MADRKSVFGCASLTRTIERISHLSEIRLGGAERVTEHHDYPNKYFHTPTDAIYTCLKINVTSTGSNMPYHTNYHVSVDFGLLIIS